MTPIRTTRLSNDPKACGGRIARPRIMAIARRFLASHGILIIEMHNPKLDSGDKLFLQNIAMRLGIARREA